MNFPIKTWKILEEMWAKLRKMLEHSENLKKKKKLGTLEEIVEGTL